MSLSIFRTLAGFLFAALLSVSMGGSALAQEQQVGVMWTYSHSPGTGHKDGLGIAGEGVIRLRPNLAVITTGGVEWTAKSYVGNGRASRIESRFRYFVGPQSLRGFGQIGAAGVNNTTSEYSKSAYFLTVGGGVSYKDFVVFDWNHFVREKQTLNRVQSNKFNVSVYVLFDRDDRWLVRVDVFVQRTDFTQPNGPDAGQHKTVGTGVRMGIGYKF